jgi:hypothetical protein
MNAPLPAHLLPKLAPRAVPPAMIEALKAAFGDRCSTALVVREQHGRDESPIDAPPPEAVVFCESTEDVAAVVKLADQHAVPVIPFGVGSSLEGHLLAGPGRHQHRPVAHEQGARRQRRGPHRHRRGGRDADAGQRRDPPHRPLLSDRPRRRRLDRRHGGDARERHQRGPLRDDARERPRPDRSSRRAAT